jgi:hypothetical protein
MHEHDDRDSAVSCDAPEAFKIPGIPIVRHPFSGTHFEFTKQSKRWKTPYNFPATCTPIIVAITFPTTDFDTSQIWLTALQRMKSSVNRL